MRRQPDRRTVPWPAGSQILLRHVRGAQTWCALPVTVLGDGGERLMLRVHVGTTWLAAFRSDGRRAHGWDRHWRLRRTVWHGHDATYAIPWGRWYGLVAFTEPGSGQVVKWYVNCQDPARRTAWGVDTMDRELDVVLLPPGTGPARWKDLREFARLVRSGCFPRHRARRLMAQAVQARELIQCPQVRSELSAWLGPAGPVPDLNTVLATLPMPAELRSGGGSEAAR